MFQTVRLLGALLAVTMLASCSTTPTITRDQCLAFCARQHSSVRQYDTGGMVPFPLKVPTSCQCHESEPWTSERGRTCFYECQRDRFACSSKCSADSACVPECHRQETTCLTACPDLMPVVPAVQKTTETFKKLEKKPEPMFELIH